VNDHSYGTISILFLKTAHRFLFLVYFYKAHYTTNKMVSSVDMNKYHIYMCTSNSLCIFCSIYRFTHDISPISIRDTLHLLNIKQYSCKNGLWVIQVNKDCSKLHTHQD